MKVTPPCRVGTKDTTAFSDLWEDDTVAGETSSDDDGSHSSAHNDSKAKSMSPLMSLGPDPKLDDLEILARYEARIDRENGWDRYNLDTFGEAECDHDALVGVLFDEPARTVPLGKSALARPRYAKPSFTIGSKDLAALPQWDSWVDDMVNVERRGHSAAHGLPSVGQQRAHVSSLDPSAAPWHPHQLRAQDQDFLDGYMAAIAWQ